jgi:hypothetical protein
VYPPLGRLCNPLANHIKLALKSQIIREAFAPANKDLPDQRLGGFGCRANGRIINRDVAPAEYTLPLFMHNCFKGTLALQSVLRVVREKNHSDRVLTGWWKDYLQSLAFQSKELVRKLQENTGPIASILFPTRSAAMFQVHQDLQRILNNAMGLPPGEINDKT